MADYPEISAIEGTPDPGRRIMGLLGGMSPDDIKTIMAQASGVGANLAQIQGADSTNINFDLSGRYGPFELAGNANRYQGDYGISDELSARGGVRIPLGKASITPRVQASRSRELSEYSDPRWSNSPTQTSAEFDMPMGDGRIGVTAEKQRTRPTNYRASGSIPIGPGDLGVEATFAPAEGERAKRLAAALTYSMKF
jgi:hypothetical protein